MMAGPRVPLNWFDDPPDPGGGHQIIDGTATGRTIPEFMDPEGAYDKMTILRIQGVDGRPLPKEPFKIRMSVEKHVGRIEGAFPETRSNSYALKVRSRGQVNRLLGLTTLLDGTRVEVIRHPALNTTRCVVSCRDVVDMPDGQLLEDLRPQGVREIRRITRRVGNERVNTPTIIVTVEGTTYPEALDFGYIRCRPRPYYPSPMQCFNCWAFGHTKMRCQQRTPNCGKCSKDHLVAEDRACPNDKYCRHCETGDHAVSDRSCPLYRKESDIQRIKVDQGLSYPAARAAYERANQSTSYSNVVASGVQSSLDEMNRRLSEMAKQLADKDSLIVQLQATLQMRNEQTPTPAPVTNETSNELMKELVAITKRQEETINKLSQSLEATKAQAKADLEATKAQAKADLASATKAMITTQTQTQRELAEMKALFISATQTTQKVVEQPEANRTPSPKTKSASEQQARNTDSEATPTNRSKTATEKAQDIDSSPEDGASNLSISDIFSDSSPNGAKPGDTPRPLLPSRQQRTPLQTPTPGEMNPRKSSLTSDRSSTPKRSAKELTPPSRQTKPPQARKVAKPSPATKPSNKK